MIFLLFVDFPTLKSSNIPNQNINALVLTAKKEYVVMQFILCIVWTLGQNRFSRYLNWINKREKKEVRRSDGCAILAFGWAEFWSVWYLLLVSL